ncbi:MAG: acyl--CoA ligase [Planctomycetes bacterium]|nr:acyl--CoA ligase [Planctomycetota bacterium]
MNLGPLQLLERAAQAWPDNTAVREDERTTTFAELWELSRACALEPGARTILLTAGGREALTRYTSIQRAGGVVVELNPTLPDPELIAILRAAEPSGALSDEDSRPRLKALWREAFAADVPWLEATSERPQEDLPARGPASLVFTSGTTGAPKGVRLSHENLAAVTAAIAASFELEPPNAGESAKREVFLAGLPLYYTYGRSVVFLAAALGAELVFTSRALTPGRVVSLTREHAVTHLSLVPYQALALLRRPEFSASELTSVKRVTVAGGALPEASLAELIARFPGAVFPMYGLTEAATRLTCLHPREFAGRPRSCGRAIAGVELAVADEHGAQLAPGDAGEILARGPNLTAGYFGDPAGTGELFQEGWLRTGDLGVLDAEGYLTIQGRLKDLIKCMGERFSGQSIEDVVLELPGVVEAAAIGVPDLERGEAVVLFVVSEGPIDEAALRAQIAGRLGRAKVPVRVHALPELPKTGSGKVRKSLLREPSA